MNIFDSPGETYHVLTFSNIAITLILLFIGNIIVGCFRYPKFDKSLPWVGKYGPVLGLFRLADWISEGYEKHSRQGRSFVLPGPLGIAPTIIIPSQTIPWLVDQPDDVVSTTEAEYDLLRCDYSFPDPELIRTNYHGHVVKLNLSRRLHKVIPALLDEVIFNVDDVLGQNTDSWTTLNIWNTFLTMVPRITNRFMVGFPMCRNEDYVKNMVRFTNDVILHSIALSLWPKSLWFIVGTALGHINNYHYRRTAKHSIPLIKHRLSELAQKDANDPLYEHYEEPEDYITWQIRTAQAEDRKEELDPIKISHRILPVNFAAIHTTSITAHSIILDLISTSPHLNVIEQLREEASRLWRENNGTWTKESLSRMYRIDSACRESMRISGFAKILVERKVIHPAGLTNKTEGWHAEYGTTIGCPVWEIQHDDDLIPGGHANVFDAFRYSRAREEWESRSAADKTDIQESLRLKQTGMVTTSNKHFPFSHGRHACPGRFFVAHELKMMVAYMVMNYDFKMIKERPKCSWIGKDILPPTKANMEVRRRKGTEKKET